MRGLFSVACGLIVASSACAETIDLERAIEKALRSDLRIEERQHLVGVARGLLEEVEGHGSWFVDMNSFVGLTTQVDGTIFKGGACTAAQCELRDDRREINGLTPWFNLQLGLIKPLYTFGKLENYSEAAQANIDIKSGDVRLRRGATVLEVKRAYYGYLAARDGRRLLVDVNKRLQRSIDLVVGWLEEGGGDVQQADLYALQSGQAMLGKFRAQSAALEKIALDGLKLVTGVDLDQELEVYDRRLRPLPEPEWSLPELKTQALKQREEMLQLQAGLKARRSLLKANKAESRPNLYAGLVGMAAYSPARDRLNNPHIYDPFNDIGMTPIFGLQWKWSPGLQSGKTNAAQAELDALIAKSGFAGQGIPYQVAEQYYQVQGYAEAVQQLEEASRSARRWMVASYTDFEAGLGKAEKIMMAFQGYVLASADYLQTTFEYNMHVAKLENAAGMIE